MQNEHYQDYLELLKTELVPALGCTEPIAIAYAAAKAKEVLGKDPKQIVMNCSGNIIKNVKAVTVPNSGGLKGIEVAAVLGAIGGNASKELEVLKEITEADREKAVKLLKKNMCECKLAEGVANLYIKATVISDQESASVTIKNEHTNIIKIEKNEAVIFEKDEVGLSETQKANYAKSQLNVKDILAFADCVKMEEVSETIERQIDMNTAIAQEGLDNSWGARIGKTLLHVWGDDLKVRACARAAAGSDARMGGCSLPVVINAGSGNQGMTVSLPVIECAKDWGVSKEKLIRSLVVSNLISLHLKYYIGSLSAFCGAVTAACGAGAAITYMHGGDYDAISKTIINTLGNVGGIVCDGAKPSCAAKVASSLNAALLAHYMGAENIQFKGGEGFIENCVEETIMNMGYIGRVGMKETDIQILNVMIDKADTSL